MRSSFIACCLHIFLLPCLGVELAATPQMGWNTWNSFKANYNQSIIETTAKILVDSGLKDVGYNYLVLDEGWQAFERDNESRQQGNITRFPDGIPSLVQTLHNMGFQVGIYSDAGIYDCGFYPGSYGYEELDAQTFASWEIDYLKYDNCGGFQGNILPPQERFGVMRDALRNTGRDVFFSLCQWGHQFPWFWANNVGQSYRMSGDIQAEFATDASGVCTTAYCLNNGYAGVSVLTMIRKMREISLFQAPGSWADMDMLEIGLGNMTEFEEQTHQSFWAALKSPLIIGADLSNLKNTSLQILLNREIIAINQNAGNLAATYLPDASIEGEIQIWSAPYETNSSHVVLALNEGTKSVDITIPFSKIPGLGTGHKIRDVWEAKDLGAFNSSITFHNVNSHQTKVLVLT